MITKIFSASRPACLARVVKLSMKSSALDRVYQCYGLHLACSISTACILSILRGPLLHWGLHSYTPRSFQHSMGQKWLRHAQPTLAAWVPLVHAADMLQCYS